MWTNQALGWEDSFANPRPHSRDEYFGHSCIQTSQLEQVKVVQKILHPWLNPSSPTYLPEAKIFFCWFHARQAIPEEWPRKVLKGASSPTLSREVDASQCIFVSDEDLPKMMNCSIISAREELQIILRKSDLNSQFTITIYPQKKIHF